MSKSKGNTIDPLTVVEKYGADALRMALLIRSSAGLDKSVGESDFKAARNLTNKLWNAARFALMMIKESGAFSQTNNNQHKPLDITFTKKLNLVVDEISGQLSRHQIGLAAETAHNYFWHWFCDECIEQTKNEQLSIEQLFVGLAAFLKIFHPFMPFITEQLWQELVSFNLVEERLLANSSWPKLI